MPLPKVIWEPFEFHKRLMKALDEAYKALRDERSDFDSLWVTGSCLPGTRTNFRQVALLGSGGDGRNRSGFFNFSQSYSEAEGCKFHPARCSFERYQDFAFYTGGDWYQGEKIPLMVAEVESNSAELLGELSGLCTIRAPHKYLFIDSNDTLGRLTSWCENDHSAYDWAQTTYHVIEIPRLPALPSTWMAYKSTVCNHGERIEFEKI